MYNNALKKERVSAQINALGGLGFWYGSNLNKFVNILLDDEDIYGFLTGISDETNKWSLVFCTNYNIYILDRNKLFGVTYSQFDVRAFVSFSAERESMLFNFYKVKIQLGHARYSFDNCDNVYIENFRNACNRAKAGAGLPYAFNKELYSIQEEEYTNDQNKTIDAVEPVTFNSAVKQEQPIIKSEFQLQKEKELAEKYMDGSNSNSVKNGFIYYDESIINTFYNETITKQYTPDTSNSIQYNKYKELTGGLTPKYSDYRFLKTLDIPFIHKIIDENRLRDLILYGRNGSLYQLKNEYDFQVTDEDYTSDENSYWLKLNYVDRTDEEMIIKNNHIASRFLKSTESKEESQPDETYIEDFPDDFLAKYQEEIKNSEESKSNSYKPTKETEDSLFDSKEVEQEEESVEFNLNLNEILNRPEEKELPKKDVFEEIRSYKQLLDEKIITQEEFDYKKKELLGL